MRLPSARQKIIQLILLFGAGIFSAFLLAFLLIYHYGPTGKYLVKNSLLDPELVNTLAYNDTNDKTGGLTRYVSDGIELIFYNSKAKQMENRRINSALYKRLYELIANDTSQQENGGIETLFFPKEAIMTLAIKVRTESHASWIDETKDFQRVDFVQNHFRIRLHEEKNPNNWVYFSHPKIYQKVMQVISDE